MLAHVPEATSGTRTRAAAGGEAGRGSISAGWTGCEASRASGTVRPGGACYIRGVCGPCGAVEARRTRAGAGLTHLAVDAPPPCSQAIHGSTTHDDTVNHRREQGSCASVVRRCWCRRCCVHHDDVVVQFVPSNNSDKPRTCAAASRARRRVRRTSAIPATTTIEKRSQNLDDQAR